MRFDIRTLYLKVLSFIGCTVLNPGVIAALIRQIEAGKIASLVAETYPLSGINRAQEAFFSKRHIGKIVPQAA